MATMANSVPLQKIFSTKFPSVLKNISEYKLRRNQSTVLKQLNLTWCKCNICGKLEGVALLITDPQLTSFAALSPPRKKK